jgi:hypothetical protein
VEVLWSHDGAGWFGQGLTLSQKLSPKLPVALPSSLLRRKKEKKRIKKNKIRIIVKKNKKKFADSRTGTDFQAITGFSF